MKQNMVTNGAYKDAKMLNMDVKSSKDNWSIVEERIQA